MTRTSKSSGAIRRRPLRRGRRQGGQAVVLFGLFSFALFGLVGLALDSGHAFDDRRALQGAADTAADAGMHMVLLDYHNQSTPPWSDSQISSKVQSLVNASKTAASGITSYTAYYIDETNAVYPAGCQIGHLGSGGACGASATLTLCTSAAQSSCIAGVQVTPKYTHSTLFLSVLGIKTTTEAATSQARYNLGAPSTSGFLTFVVWHSNCDNVYNTGYVPDSDPAGEGDQDPTAVGDLVRVTDNHFFKNNSSGDSMVTACGSNNESKSSDFKGGFNGSPWGYLANTTVEQCDSNAGSIPVSPTETTINANDCIDAAHGSPGNTPHDCNVYIMPVIDAVFGSEPELHVSSFMAMKWAGCTIPADTNDDYIVQWICQAGSNSSTCIPPASIASVTSGFYQ